MRPARLPAAAGPRTQPIPISGERVPVIGMGSWLTFDVPPLGPLVDTRVEVLRAFFAAGGGMIDSSPMYGHAEDVIGRCLRRLGAAARPLFAATKVWTPLAWHGRRQVEDSFRLWGVERFSLLQIHNMVSWEGHYETLRALQAEGRVRYVGITTSHGRRHRELETALRAKPFDFVQLTYNLGDREAEARLLPLAAERGIAVIANRPFRRGDLIDRLAARPLPSWAAEIDCQGWPQVLLKFVVSHPAVTCAIPATSDPEHMVENMGASRGRLPDAALRRRMVREVAPLLG
ncbi:MAG TPA: aldo/keto reductase [Thermoanaerobaculia bacterium]|nr:aldo/keto reductase [Thermoanaerobaculia bacterium]